MYGTELGEENALELEIEVGRPRRRNLGASLGSGLRSVRPRTYLWIRGWSPRPRPLLYLLYKTYRPSTQHHNLLSKAQSTGINLPLP